MWFYYITQYYGIILCYFTEKGTTCKRIGQIINYRNRWPINEICLYCTIVWIWERKKLCPVYVVLPCGLRLYINLEFGACSAYTDLFKVKVMFVHFSSRFSTQPSVGGPIPKIFACDRDIGPGGTMTTRECTR